MTPADTVRAFCAAWGSGDMEDVYALMADDIVYHNIPLPVVHGVAGARAFLGAFRFDEAEFRIHALAAEGDTVLTERTDRFRVGDAWMELPVMGVFEVAGGKIAKWRDYFDMGQMNAGMAALNPPSH